jgi:hypothetical protein
MLKLRNLFARACDHSLRSHLRQAMPSRTRHRLTANLSLETRQMLAALSFTPSNFSSGVTKVQKGDTVSFAAGSYKISAAAKSTLQNAKSLTGIQGKTTLDFSGESSLQILNISGANGGSVSGLKVLNAGFQVENSPGFVVENSSFDGYLGKTTTGKTKGLVSFANSDGASVRNININWTNTSENLNAVAFRSSNNVNLSNSTLNGRLKQGAVFNTVSNGTISGNTITRAKGTPGAGAGNHVPLGEDHGVYILNVNNMKVQNNTIGGWSQRASGHAIKVKDGIGTVVSGNTLNDSGIIVRTNQGAKQATNSKQQNLRILDNQINAGDIHVWTPDLSPTSVRIEGNKLANGEVTIQNGDPQLFNQNNGGVFNNVAKKFNLLPGINNSGNKIA